MSLLAERLPKESLEEIFQMTRIPDFHFKKKQDELADFLSRNQLDLKDLVAKVIKSDKTGWKEVVGNITKITGICFVELEISKANIEKLKAFGNCIENPILKKEWRTVISKKLVEI